MESQIDPRRVLGAGPSHGNRLHGHSGAKGRTDRTEELEERRRDNRQGQTTGITRGSLRARFSLRRQQADHLRAAVRQRAGHQHLRRREEGGEEKDCARN